MKRIMKESKGNTSKRVVRKKTIKKDFQDNKIADVNKLVELLQIHQVELEHQNQELRITQEELEVSRNKYVNLFDFSPIPYFTLDDKGIINEVNLSGGKMLNVDRSKLVGKNFILHVMPDEKDIFYSFIKNVFNSKIKCSCELKLISKDKDILNVLLEGFALDDTLEEKRKCQIAIIDMTEYKRIENNLKKSMEELSLLNATKDKFFSIIAHDLRSPFQGLISSSELLAMEIDSLSKEEIQLFSKGLYNSLRNLYGLLENLLKWSMVQRDMIEFKPVNIDLYELVNKIIELSIQNAEKKNISIINNIGTGTLVNADLDMLKSIFQNLITNAVKFTKSEGRVIVTAKNKDDIVEIYVDDSGIGIEFEKISKLFSFHAINTTDGTAGEKGTGLGLPLCKELIEKNNGKIWVESILGKGTKFTFTLQKGFL